MAPILGGIEGVGLYQSRIWNDARITPETLAAMEAGLADAAGVIMPGFRLDVVAYGCTSASMVIGEDRVAERIAAVHPEARVTTPITGAFAAFRAFEARRLAVLTPYRDDVNATVRRYIEARGFEVPVFGSFNEEDDHKVARISPASIRDAAIELAGTPAVDAVFVACTSLRVAAHRPRDRGGAGQARHLQQPRHGLARAPPGRDRHLPAGMGPAVRAAAPLTLVAAASGSRRGTPARRSPRRWDRPSPASCPD